MAQNEMTRWQFEIASELEQLQACYLADREGTTPRPSAPIDELIEQVKEEESPLLFKRKLSDFYYQIQGQQRRPNHSLATIAQLEKSLRTIDLVLERFSVDLGTAITADDLAGVRFQPGTIGTVDGLLQEKIRVIEGVTGHLLSKTDRRNRFATWSDKTPINDVLFPIHDRIEISTESNLADLPISGETQILCHRLESKLVSAKWSTLIQSYPLDCFFTTDAAVFPLDLSWIVTFCHSDYGLFARREVSKTV